MELNACDYLIERGPIPRLNVGSIYTRVAAPLVLGSVYRSLVMVLNIFQRWIVQGVLVLMVYATLDTRRVKVVDQF